MGAVVVGSSVVVLSALVLGLALFARRPTQPAMAGRPAPRRPVTGPSSGTTAAASAAAAVPTVAGVARPPAPAGGAPRVKGRKARRLRDGPGPKPQVRTPWWVRLRSGALLALSVVAIAALVGATASLVVVLAGLVLT